MESRYNDFNIEVIKNANYPLIKIMKSSYEKKLKAEREKERQEKCKLLALQTKGVNMVKEHILKRKREFLCHQRERILLKQVKKKELEENILHKYKINLQNIDTRNKIVNKLINYDKCEKMKMNTQKQRMKFIVQKLLTEMETKEKEKQSTPPKQKVLRRKPEEPFYLDDIIIDEEADEEVIPETKIEIEDWEDVETKKPVPSRSLESRKSRKSKHAKKSIKKSINSVTSKKSKEKIDPNEYKMPQVPVINPRHKYIDIVESKMVDLIPTYQAMNAYLDDLKDFLTEMETYPIDAQFFSKPQILHFEDFENGKMYILKLNIYNFSTDTAICSFERIISDNEFCNVSLEIEDVGMQKIIPGKHYTLQVTFRPKDMQHLQGKLVFLTRRIHDSELKRFEVPVTCEIATIKLSIKPPVILFKSIPIWKIVANNCKDCTKKIEVHNGMIYDCKLVIRRKNEAAIIDEPNVTPESISEIKSSIITIRKSRRSKKYKLHSNSILYGIDDSDSISIFETYKTIRSIIESCIDYIDNIFHLNSYFVNLPAKSTTLLKALCKQLPHVGFFQELYEFEFISASNNTLLTEVISFEAELTGKFITPEQQYIDFNSCMYNFIYQESVKIFNHGTSRIKIGFLFPSKIKKYFSIYPATLFMKAATHETVHIRFMPRPDLKQCKSRYFDKFTGILNFPIKICILAPRDLCVPPTSLTVYSIITESDKLNIRFRDKNRTYFNSENVPILYLGTVTTHETVTADIEIENLSAIVQDYGFLTLPEALAIDPNYGFGTINPNEIKTLRVLFSPTIYDMITVDKIHTYEPVEVSYKITCTTAYKLGEINDKQVPNTKIIQKQKLSLHHISTEQVLPSYYEFETDDDLFEYHEYLFEQEELEQMYKNEDEYNADDTNIITKVEEEETNMETQKKLTIILKATIVDYWTEISHQNIIFPDTPLGSYSAMSFQFSAMNNTSAFVECVCGFIKKTKLPNFDCHFEIFGGAEGITVEPICGDLKKNERKQIYIIAKPLPDAKEVFNQTQLLKQNRKSTIKINKERNQSVKMMKNTPDMDLYLAEKQVWKSIKPYNILANYVIVVNFTGDSYKSNEIIYLTVSCSVIKPQFITSLKTQIINFGYVPLDTRPKQIFQIQNVSRHSIVPKIQLMSPVGPFICNTQHNLLLEKEFLLKIPITFSPTKEEVYNEYFEIKSENTTETVMVSGEGVTPDYQIFPKFNVFRITSRGSKFEDCVIKFENKCKAPITLQIVQTCELQGVIQPAEPDVKVEEVKRPSSDKQTKPEKKSDISKATSAKKTTKKTKTEAMTVSLTPEEELSLANTFKIHEGLSPFKVQDSNTMIVKPYTKATIKIRFESPKIVEVKENAANDEHKGKRKEEKNKKVKMVTVPLDKEFNYVAKYNIMMGDIILIKELIIIGTFQ